MTQARMMSDARNQADTEAQRPSGVVPIEQIIEDARQGKMFILVDAEDRENEGDLIIPADFASPEAVNFMAMHGRGLICLAITSEQAQQLDLKLMTNSIDDPMRTAFTTSIEASSGVTTGISAFDRSRTIRVATAANSGPDDIVSPGHVFPLIAKSGGTLQRPGHTEAAVDISRAAGLTPAGVICEILNEDGTMARLDDLIPFAQEHGLNIGTIADLIEWRQVHALSLQKKSAKVLHQDNTELVNAFLFESEVIRAQHLAVIREIEGNSNPPVVCIGQVDPAEDLFGDRPLEQLRQYLHRLDQPSALIVPNRLQVDSEDSRNSRQALIAGEILLYLGLTKVEVMSASTAQTAIGQIFSGLGITIQAWADLPEETSK